MRGVDVPVIEVQPQSDVEGFAAELDVGMFVNPGSASVRRADSDLERDGTGSSNWPARHTRHGWTGATGQDQPFRRRRSFGRRCACWSTGPRTRYRHRGRRISMQGDGPVSMARIDRYGNPLGGVRSPHLDVPLACFEAHSGPGPICQLRAARRRWPRRPLVAGTATRVYLSEFTEALDATIRAGYLLPPTGSRSCGHAADQARRRSRTNEEEVLTP